jgi:hypothetical protein
MYVKALYLTINGYSFFFILAAAVGEKTRCYFTDPVQIMFSQSTTTLMKVPL